MSAEEVKRLLIGEKLSHRDRHNRNKDHQMGDDPGYRRKTQENKSIVKCHSMNH